MSTKLPVDEGISFAEAPPVVAVIDHVATLAVEHPVAQLRARRRVEPGSVSIAPGAPAGLTMLNPVTWAEVGREVEAAKINSRKESKRFMEGPSFYEPE